MRDQLKQAAKNGKKVKIGEFDFVVSDLGDSQFHIATITKGGPQEVVSGLETVAKELKESGAKKVSIEMAPVRDDLDMPPEKMLEKKFSINFELEPQECDHDFDIDCRDGSEWRPGFLHRVEAVTQEELLRNCEQCGASIIKRVYRLKNGLVKQIKIIK
jgi:hypothetical protein